MGAVEMGQRPLQEAAAGATARITAALAWLTLTLRESSTMDSLLMGVRQKCGEQPSMLRPSVAH